MTATLATYLYGYVHERGGSLSIRWARSTEGELLYRLTALGYEARGRRFNTAVNNLIDVLEENGHKIREGYDPHHH